MMTRAFCTHKIRRQMELTKLWSFTPLSGNERETRLVAVPSCWESYPDFGDYRGKARYETTFQAGGNLRVVCKGVSHTAKLSLDHQEIARHEDAYTAFSSLIQPVEEGEHTLSIEVSNEFSQASALHIPNDYMSYGGITRPVLVELLPEAFIEWVHATPNCVNGEWQLSIETKVYNLSDQAQQVVLAHRLGDRESTTESITVRPKDSCIFRLEKSCPNVKTYTLENPALYILETLLFLNDTAAPADDLMERVGFRSIRVEGETILFNDQPLRIKGFCRHEDHPHFGCSLPFQAMDYDLNLMKELGANAVRTSHYPNDELFLDLCDEKGILVWEESHARGLSEERMRHPNFKTQSRQCISAMIENHYNHPAIIIWGILNECASDTAYGYECYAEQFAQIRALDGSRPVSFASCRFFQDKCLGLPDIVSYNLYPEWYEYPEWPKDNSTETMFTALYRWIQQSTEGAGKPILISEIGAGAIYGNRNPRHSKWSEERQGEILTHQLEKLMEMRQCSGFFIWQFCDCRVSEEWFAQRPRAYNNKGIVDEYRRPKLAFDVVKKILHDGKN